MQIKIRQCPSILFCKWHNHVVCFQSFQAAFQVCKLSIPYYYGTLRPLLLKVTVLSLHADYAAGREALFHSPVIAQMTLYRNNSPSPPPSCPFSYFHCQILDRALLAYLHYPSNISSSIRGFYKGRSDKKGHQNCSFHGRFLFFVLK